MTTILGENISMIRPRPAKRCRVYKNEKPYTRRQGQKPKLIKHNSGKPEAVVVETKDGKLYQILKGLHLDVLEAFGISPEAVARTGWLLSGDRYVWK